MTGPENLFFNKERLNHRISSAKILLRENLPIPVGSGKILRISCRKEIYILQERSIFLENSFIPKR
jgi:hypothetical protein